jgi:hypothetical protein
MTAREALNQSGDALVEAHNLRRPLAALADLVATRDEVNGYAAGYAALFTGKD